MFATERECLNSLPDCFRFRFDAAVMGSDGQIGTLRHVLLEPDTNRVIGLVLRTGLLFSRELRVSLGAIVSATEAEIQLSITAREAGDLKRKQAMLLHAERSASIGGSSRRVACGMQLRSGPALSDAVWFTALDGSAGRMRQLLVDAATGELLEYVIETGLLARQRRRLPARHTLPIAGTAPGIHCTVASVTSLPPYIGDQELRAHILDAWFYDDVLRLTLLRAPLEVQVREGKVVLEGYVPQRAIVSRLQARARSVPGVLKVHSAIVADEDLVPEVLSALENDPRTQLVRPSVRSSLGVIHLEGQAPDRVTRETIAEISATVPGVSTVVNQLRVREAYVPHGPTQRLLSSLNRLIVGVVPALVQPFLQL